MKTLAPFLFILFCSGAGASDWSASRNTPPEAMDAIRRARAEYEAAGAKIPVTRYVWLTKPKSLVLGAYGLTLIRGRHWVVYVNAFDFKWPNWRIGLDKVYLHEIGHTLGWGHYGADSVMEPVLREHLMQSDLSRLQEIRP